MEKFIINGQKELDGDIEVAGAKNNALKLLAACLLTAETVELKNVPDIADVKVMIDIMQDLGGVINKEGDNNYTISAQNVNKTTIERKLASKLRTSIMFVAPLLARFGEAKFPHPGGCVIGQRPIDMFLNGYKAFGATITEDEKYFHIKCQKLKGTKIVFPWISHTVTESMIMTAVLAEGQTVLVNAACEPEVEALIELLNQLGADIKGAGSHTIVINGVKTLGSGTFATIPDRIEAGTFAILGALAAKELNIKNCRPQHLEVLLSFFDRIGISYKRGNDYLKVSKAKEIKPTQVRTHEYPGFITDLQAPFTVLLTQAKGVSMVHEVIYEGRLFYTDKLIKMGARIIMCDPHRIIVEGPTPLYAAQLESPDIRAGIALIMASLIAEGQSEISNIYQVDRGYQRIAQRLKGIGADITRTK
ncbi:MAG: UDP-N-acetylglucosamine 1-carboxyvinyltransferase [Patescibacteria group bacterium]